MEMSSSARHGPPNASRPPRGGAGWLRRQGATALFSLLVGGGLAYGYLAYLRSDDVSPDSVSGYGFAIAGTLLLALVGVGYVLRKRLRRNWSGLLHTALTWHVVGGVFGLALILMHATGNFHPRTGTYALYGLIALVVSGLIGRLLDRVAPRFAAQAALATLTSGGEERLDALVDVLHGTWRGRRDKRHTPSREADVGIPWDLAYHDLGASSEQIPSLLTQGVAGAARGAPPNAADLTQRAMGKDALVAESAQIRRAIGRERFFLRLIRVWRWTHTLLSLVTLALILWHLEYAAVLLLGAR